MNHFAATTTTHRIAISHCAVPSGSSLELIEPETGCQVVLVGCFHGSKSSAMDVSTSLLLAPDNDNNSENETTTTHVVVLELCASRFADMRRDMERTEKQSTQRPWLMRYGTMISKTVQSRGLSTGLAAALLGGVSGMQTSLSGLEPGLEFRTAVQHVQEHGGDDDNACDIILADQNVDETLDKVGNLFAISVQMWQTYWKHGWEASFGREAAALGRAVWGGGSPQEESLNLWDFCTRNTESIRDMVRLLVPPAVMLQVIVVTINQGMAWLATQSTGNAEVLLDALNADTASMTLSDSLSVLAMNSSILTAGYLFMALPAVRVILRERDDTLTQGIRQACRVAAAKAGDNQRGRVVAVLGLLHVNGIAERLRGNVNDEAAKERK